MKFNFITRFYGKHHFPTQIKIIYIKWKKKKIINTGHRTQKYRIRRRTNVSFIGDDGGKGNGSIDCSGTWPRKLSVCPQWNDVLTYGTTTDRTTIKTCGYHTWPTPASWNGDDDIDPLYLHMAAATLLCSHHSLYRWTWFLSRWEYISSIRPKTLVISRVMTLYRCIIILHPTTTIFCFFSFRFYHYSYVFWIKFENTF